ncbi:MAG: ABC transporter ATP-binding protein [Desulfomonilia bacterium]|nr:ABC transporter ATP-binding protein [Desulfomonilia bacterium]
MAEPIITVESLSKKYRIGARELKDRTFREAVVDAFAAPVRNFRRLRQLTRFDDAESGGAPLLPGTTAASPGDVIWALKDVSFEVQPGEVVGVIGKNGAGKSTLLKILSRITEPSSGEIRLYGRVSSLLEVGTGFHPELTGRENIYLNGTILGMRKTEIDAKFDEIVAFSEIEKFLDTPVKRYSSGMYVRLAFAVAAHLEPEILLVDEVLAVGDAEFQKKCLGKMGDVAREGRTVLFVSHNMTAIRNLCTKAIWIEKGHIGKEGSVEDVCSEYLYENTSLDISDIHNQIRSTPQGPLFELLDVMVHQNDKITSICKNSDPIVISTLYTLHFDIRDFRIYFDICDEDGTILIRSFHDEHEDNKNVFLPGTYRSTAIIPPYLLAPKNYLLIIRATIHNQRNLIPDGIKIILTIDNSAGINRAYPNEPIRSKIMPFIQWETNQPK